MDTRLVNGPRPTTNIARIAFVITELEVGGAERCLVELVTRLDRCRFEPHVYCLDAHPRGLRPTLLGRLEASKVPIIDLRARGIISVPLVVLRLARALRRGRFDAVQTFLHHANIVGRLAAHRAHTPAVFSGIRVAEHRHNGYLALDRWTQRWVTRHVCVSQAVADFSIEHAGLDAARIVVIPNGVDTARFDAARPFDSSALGVARGRRLITYVGRLDAQKRVGWLMERMAHCLPKLPNHDVVIVGHGPDRAALEAQCRTLGIAERIHFTGWRAEVPQILKASQLFVLASAWEGMPNVVLEAMASALPVVGTEVEGMTELLGPAADEQIAGRHDAEGFERRVVELARDPVHAGELGRRNRDRAERHFSIDAMVGGYQALYERFLPQRAR